MPSIEHVFYILSRWDTMLRLASLVPFHVTVVLGNKRGSADQVLMMTNHVTSQGENSWSVVEETFLPVPEAVLHISESK